MLQVVAMLIFSVFGRKYCTPVDNVFRRSLSIQLQYSDLKTVSRIVIDCHVCKKTIHIFNLSKLYLIQLIY